jgi:hypothetical protein
MQSLQLNNKGLRYPAKPRDLPSPRFCTAHRLRLSARVISQRIRLFGKRKADSTMRAIKSLLLIISTHAVIEHNVEPLLSMLLQLKVLLPWLTHGPISSDIVSKLC